MHYAEQIKQVTCIPAENRLRAGANEETAMPLPTDLPSTSPDTIAALFRSVAARHASRPAIATWAVRLSFAELDARSDALAGALARTGVKPGSIVGTLLIDGLAMIELLVATAKLGATILTLNWRLAAPELSYMMNDAQPFITFVSDCHEKLMREADPPCRVVVVANDDALEAGRNLAESDESASGARGRQQIEGSRNWLLLYTSGTTGRPKGCMHSQRGYYLNARSCAERMGFRDTDRALLTQPLFHVGGLHIFLSVHASGGCVVIPPRGMDHQAMLQLVSAEEISFQTIPILDPGGYLAAHRTLALPTKLRLMHGGGGLHSPELLSDIGKAFNTDMILGYGQSEGGGLISLISLAEQLERPKSCGKPLPHLEARIIDDSGLDVADGDPGELLIRGATITTGYLNLPDATLETIAEGWLHTGDIFRRDHEGYLYFTGRKKELIKSGGENVYPGEVERIIHEHPAVERCCVVGVDDSRYGQAVKAFIVLAPEEILSPRAIADWCRTRIAGYKRPRFVEFVDSIPCDFQAKPQRNLLSRLPVTPEQSTDSD